MATREELEEGAEVKSIVVAGQDDYADADFSDFNDDQPAYEMQEAIVSEKGSPYRKGKTRTLLEIGSIGVTYGQAKLFGLLDREGNVDLSRIQNPNISSQKDFQRKHVDLLSQPTKVETKSPPIDEEATFKPQKTAIALKAMRNPRCGYDFIQRLNERGDPLESLTNVSKKKNTDAEKEAYDLKLDKLQCPSCRRYQTFDEYTEKRRLCPVCNEKYTKLNVCDPILFEKKLKRKAEKREANLAKIEEEMYHYEKTPFRAKPLNKALYQSTKENTRQAAASTLPSMNSKDMSSSNTSTRLKQPTISGRGTSGDAAGAPAVRTTANKGLSSSAPVKPVSVAPSNLNSKNAVTSRPKDPAILLPSRTLMLETKTVNEKKKKMSEKFKSLLEY